MPLSAPQAPLALALDFGADDLLGRADTLLEFVGIVLNDAQVRTKLDQNGMPRPVLCLDLGQVGPGRHTLHAQQLYAEAERDRAQALAAWLRRGARVRVHSNLLHMHLCLSQVGHVALLAPAPLGRASGPQGRQAFF